MIKSKIQGSELLMVTYLNIWESEHRTPCTKFCTYSTTLKGKCYLGWYWVSNQCQLQLCTWQQSWPFTTSYLPALWNLEHRGTAKPEPACCGLDCSLPLSLLSHLNYNSYAGLSQFRLHGASNIFDRRSHHAAHLWNGSGYRHLFHRVAPQRGGFHYNTVMKANSVPSS